MENAQRNEGLSIVGSLRCFFWIILVHVLGGVPFLFVQPMMVRVGLQPHLWIIRELAINIFVIWRLSVKRGLSLSVDKKKAGRLFRPVLLLVLGTRLIFDNSLVLFLSRFEPAGWLKEAVGEMFEFPLLGMLVLFISGPVFEEIIFRGFFLKQLLPRYGPAVAIACSALLFGIMHFNLHQAVNAFVLGIVFGIIYYKTGSLLLSIAAHMANNIYVPFASVIITDYMMKVSVLQLMGGACTLLLGAWLLGKRMIEPGG